MRAGSAKVIEGRPQKPEWGHAMISRLNVNPGRFWKGFFGDSSGAVAMIFALALLPIFGAVGLAADSSLGYLMKSRMSKSLDAAGLAAGRVALNDSAELVARQYFDSNFQDGELATVTDFRFELDDSRQFVTLSVEAEAPTIFMRIFGRDTMTVTARTVIRRMTTGMELALVMDNTGSMYGSKFDAMQAAAYDLVSMIYGDDTELDNFWISLVPYTATVNIGAARTGWLDPNDRVNIAPGDFSTPGWKGCVMARANPFDETDATPATALFTSFFYELTAEAGDNQWPPLKLDLEDRNNGRGPNLGCGPEITPLTPSRATIEAAIGNMGPWHRGGTTGNLGLSWGWRTISPTWRGLWGGETPATHPLDYDTPFMEKVVVILTDGHNQFYDHYSGGGPASDFTAYGRVENLGVVTTAQGRPILDARLASTCAQMKAEGIRVYSITFGTTPDSSDQALYRACATTPAMYYHAPTNAQLAQAFRAIGGELANLRIVE